ncbi:hypothetical protein C1Y40_01693 [Mycobacterium talmoniae]|uniref:CHAD domain-containing protein n=1 Tax=Mycobacterium talmoniae TaxID=1858794 RepID=A0A2S8BN99_9MYCO|nr:hypothetical protein C1Y40_01693 [Mycobacterium talmoniae]
MRSPRYFRLLDGLDDLLAGARDHAAPANIGDAYRRVRKAVKAAKAADYRDDALHRIRKRAKRLRYTAAATKAPRVAKRAKAVQTLLGEHQDSVVSRAHLLQQADAAVAAGEDTFSYGVLYLREDELARRCRAKLGRKLRKLDKATHRGGRAGL